MNSSGYIPTAIILRLISYQLIDALITGKAAPGYPNYVIWIYALYLLSLFTGHKDK
jgi:hypothetical protein